MITCPNCAYQNPDDAVQCDACCGPLPAMIACSSCGALSQADASFCGRCGAPLDETPARSPRQNYSLDPNQVLAEPSAASAYLQHTTTETDIALPPQMLVIHIGKPNDRVPPDIDVSGFPHSEVVSRIHASICVEEDIYYIEDMGSSNGTYINNLPITVGSRCRLQDGDRIALGKEDKVAFLFKEALNK
ncbi:MAG: FHA domain-containing protein [Elainellaceae cyanobacterium]